MTSNKKALEEFLKDSYSNISAPFLKEMVTKKSILKHLNYLPLSRIYRGCKNFNTIENNFKTLYNRDENAMTEIANNKCFSEKARMSAFNTGCIVENLRNPLPEMMHEMYKSAADVFFEIGKEEAGDAWFSARVFLSKLIHKKQLPEECVRDFVNRWSLFPQAEDCHYMIMDLLEKNMLNDEGCLILAQLRDKNITQQMKFLGTPIGPKTIGFLIKNEPNPAEKEKIMILGLQSGKRLPENLFDYFLRESKSCYENIKRHFILNYGTPKKITQKILQRNMDNPEITSLLLYRNYLKNAMPTEYVAQPYLYAIAPFLNTVNKDFLIRKKGVEYIDDIQPSEMETIKNVFRDIKTELEEMQKIAPKRNDYQNALKPFIQLEKSLEQEFKQQEIKREFPDVFDVLPEKNTKKFELNFFRIDRMDKETKEKFKETIQKETNPFFLSELRDNFIDGMLKQPSHYLYKDRIYLDPVLYVRIQDHEDIYNAISERIEEIKKEREEQKKEIAEER